MKVFASMLALALEIRQVKRRMTAMVDDSSRQRSDTAELLEVSFALATATSLIQFWSDAIRAGTRPFRWIDCASGSCALLLKAPGCSDA